MATCNYIIRNTYKPIGKPRVPSVECGKPATHTLPPKHRLILCDDHAAENWGNPSPVPTKSRPIDGGGEGGNEQ